MMLRLFAGAAWWSVGLQRGRHWVAHSASEVLSSAMSLNKSSSPQCSSQRASSSQATDHVLCIAMRCYSRPQVLGLTLNRPLASRRAFVDPQPSGCQSSLKASKGSLVLSWNPTRPWGAAHLVFFVKMFGICSNHGGGVFRCPNFWWTFSKKHNLDDWNCP